MLLDSNIFIYAIQPKYQPLRDWCFQQQVMASDMTRLEVLGYHHLNELDKRDITQLFELTTLYPVSSWIVTTAIKLRQQRKMSVGDSVIAATALTQRLTLVTRNVSDFDWIEGLSVVNPIEVIH